MSGGGGGVSEGSAALRRATAFHEAGHTVLGLVLGMKLDHVTIEPADDGSEGTSYFAEVKFFGDDDRTPIASQDLFERAIEKTLAGDLAQRRAGFEVRSVHGHYDRRHVQMLLAGIPGTLNEKTAKLASLTREAEELLLICWPAIESLAALLLERFRLSGVEVESALSTFLNDARKAISLRGGGLEAEGNGGVTKTSAAPPEDELPSTPAQVLAMLSAYGQSMESGTYFLSRKDAAEIEREWYEIAKLHDRAVLAPRERTLERAIQKPIGGARASFALGYYVGALAQLGYAAEMLTLLLYKMHRPALRATGEKALASSEAFEEARQGDRIRSLESAKVVSDDSIRALRDISGLRKRHLHFFAPFTADPRSDALVAYRHLQIVMREIFAHGDVNGQIEMNEPLARFLREHTRFMEPKGAGPSAKARARLKNKRRKKSR